MANNERLNVSDELLIKYLLGEADNDEVRQVELWLNASEENRLQFERFKKIWEESEALAARSTIDVDHAWSRFKERAQGSQPIRKTISFTPRRWLHAAAILLVFITGGYLLYQNITPGYGPEIVWQALEQVRTDTLPDGSVVTMNKGATLSFAEKFAGRERIVKLQGEAFFEVAKNREKPFVVMANEARIEVLGTTFNVSTFSDETVVIVETGVVEVAKEHRSVQLTANEKAIVSKDDDDPVKEKNDDKLYQYYRSKEFVLNATPLWRFVDVLSQAYDVNITIANEDIRNLRLTTSFKDQPLQQILVVVGETLNITIEQRGTDIILR